MERSGSHLPQALAVKQFRACTLDGWWGFLWFTPVIMLIRKILIEYRTHGDVVVYNVCLPDFRVVLV
jgi:hypothetical protein